MSRLIPALVAALSLICFASSTPQAQPFSGLARVDGDQSRMRDAKGDAVVMDLHLSQGVPYRVFLLDEPPRLVLDFQEVDWTGLDRDAFDLSDRIVSVKYGTYVPGWSRMVAALGQPMVVDQVGLQIDAVTSAAHLRVRLAKANAETFAASIGAPRDSRWDLPETTIPAAPVTRDAEARLMVVLDPGHGGIDPGAQQGGLNEKELMLVFARELREALVRSGGYDVALTRTDDYFVSLERRIALAHQAGADVFISLHADSLSEGLAHGATVHVLSRDASDVASAKLAERHDRADLLSGVDLTSADDAVTGILLDLARNETQPRTEAMARALVDAMAQTGGPMNRRPLRSAAFSVLKAADIPSVLIEIGFLSSPRDLENLQNATWRAGMAEAIRVGLDNWRAADAARRPLVRQ